MINKKQVKRFCKEDISKIENYIQAVNDTTQLWDCHHRTEIWWNCSRKDLIDNDCYYNRKACELIFLTHAEHTRLHHKGKVMSDVSKRKMSKTRKGKTFSEEHCKNLSNSQKGRVFSEEHRKKLSEAHKGHRTKGSKGMTWKLIAGKRVYSKEAK